MTTTASASAGALAALALTLPIAAHAACQIETLDLPVRMIGSRAVATVGINGTPVPLTVDSGAFFSVLTEAAATQLDLRTRQFPALRVEGIAGRMDARVTTVDKLQLAKGDISRVDFVVGGNEPGAGTMGLMGRNLLSFTDTEYDLANGLIRFSFPNDDCAKANLAYWAGATHQVERNRARGLVRHRRHDRRHGACRSPRRRGGGADDALGGDLRRWPGQRARLDSALRSDRDRR
jgi:hypothetical protein